MSPNIPVTDDFIRAAYFLLLGREPESQQVIERCRSAGSISELRENILNSREFLSQCLNRLDNKSAVNAIREKEDAPTDNLVILQTCDFEKYIPMLDATRASILEYVRRWKCSYECFIGVKRGAHPWHAMFNRIYKLNEYIDSGFRGWVLYMDADSYFVDFEFDLREYLSDKNGYAMIASKNSDSPGHPYWDVNDGIFFANLSHPVFVNIARRWKRYYDVIYNDADYERAASWNSVLNDQTSLHSILKFSGYAGFIYTEATRDIFNSRRAKVIRQELRLDHKSSDDSSFERRVENVRNAVNIALADAHSVGGASQACNDEGKSLPIRLMARCGDESGGRPSFLDDECKGGLIESVYRVLLGRSSDARGLAAYKNLLNEPSDLGKILRSVVTSQEYRRALAVRNPGTDLESSLWGGRVDYVDALYRRYAGGPATSAQLASYISNGDPVWRIHRRFLINRNKPADQLRVLLFGAFGNGNIGDIYQAVAVRQHLIKEWDVDPKNVFACSVLKTSDYPFQDGNKLDASAIYDPEIVNSFDYIVVGGGGLLSHPHNPLNESAWIKKIKTPIVLLGVGASRVLLHDHEALLDTAVFVSGRDDSSFAALKSVRSDAESIPDPILCTDSVDSLTVFDTSSTLNPDPIDVLWLLKYPASTEDEAIFAAIEASMARNGGNHVIAAIEPLRDRVLNERFHKCQIYYISSLSDLIVLIKASKLVFTMRYHGAIFSAMEGRRIIASSQIKIRDLLDEAGVSHGYIQSPDALQSLIDEKGVEIPLVWLKAIRQRFVNSVSSIRASLSSQAASSSHSNMGGV